MCFAVKTTFVRRGETSTLLILAFEGKEKKKKKKNRFDCFIFEGDFPSFEILKILVVVGR